MAAVLVNEFLRIFPRNINLQRTKRLRLLRYASTDAQTRKTSNNKQNIIIPKKIDRSPTDILEALASTVSRDFTAAHYKFHDDPFLIPASNVAKRSYALAKESGRKAARWIFSQYPSNFEIVEADPKIEAFQPIPKYDETNVSVAVLEECINRMRVTSAHEVYKLLEKKGIPVNSELKQSLLELLCFNNCEDPPPSDLMEEKWFRQAINRETRKTWHDDGLAEQLFDSIEPKTPEAYCSIIRGMAKYFQLERVQALYQQMKEKQMAIDVDTYNSLIPFCIFHRDSYELRWQMCAQYLHDMNREGVKPNIRTFNAVLEVISKLGNWRNSKKLALETMGEMKALGIEPSLASYYFLMNVFCKDRGPISTVLYDVMKEVKGKEFHIQDPKDVYFFVTAMNVCHSHILDKEIALKIHELLNLGNNYVLIGDSMTEAIYYQHFFKILCFTENIDDFFKFYNQYVPNIYTPEPSVLLEILQAIELNSAWQYIPQMWTDIMIFSQFSRETLLKKMLSILAENKPEGELQEQFFNIAWDIKQRIDSQNPEKIRAIICWTGEMIGNVLQVCLDVGDFDRAWEILQKCRSDCDRISGPVATKTLLNFLQACIMNKDLTKAMFCLRYATEVDSADATIGELILNNFDLTEHERDKVRHLIGSQETGKAADDDSASTNKEKKEDDQQ